MSTSSQHPSSSSRVLTLVVESASGTPDEYFAQVGLSLGRAKSNTIHIDHPDVDHIHAKVVKRGEAFWLRCGSQAKLKVLDPEPGEVGEVELTTGLTIELGGVILRCGQQMKGMGSLSDDYWADAAGGERFCVESDSFRGDLPKKIGPYEIQKFVARGGMGIVLQGVHEATGRWVAVKLPLAKFNADLQLLQRFEKEINTLKALKHPNIVGLEDEGKEGQLYWMAMEWVEGHSVKEWREGWTKDNKQVPLNQIWVFVSQMVQGLEYLHSQEVVHRDLKPANIMVETRGEETVVKVADFGLAKRVGGEQSTGLTGTGHMPGTFHYMAPEQLDGLDITAATDVYALGLIAHELLTGKRPGRGKLKLDKLRPDCPEQIRELVARCLEDEPEDRPSLHEIENALGPLVSETEKKQAEALRIERLQQKAVQRGEELKRQQEAERRAAEMQRQQQEAAQRGGELRKQQEATPAKREAKAEPKAVAKIPANAFVNTLGMKFVPVPGTGVAFCIWKTRVKDYAAFGVKSSGLKQADTHPVVKVNWYDANAFCAWLTKKELAEGEIEAGQKYRLPTDAEWNVAAGLDKEKGPKNYTGFPKFSSQKEVANDESGWMKREWHEGVPAGIVGANKLGLHDMGGNVWEWCEDWHDPALKACRVLRGAYWGGSHPDTLLSSCRGLTPGGRYDLIGFRCVLVGGSGG